MSGAISLFSLYESVWWTGKYTFLKNMKLFQNKYSIETIRFYFCKRHLMTYLCRHRGVEEIKLQPICNLVIEGDGGQHKTPASLSQGKIWYRLTAGWLGLEGCVWTATQISLSPESDSLISSP